MDRKRKVGRAMLGSSQSFRRHLESFVRSRASIGADWFEESLTWPGEMLELASTPALAGFQWLGVRAGGTALRLYGIRPQIEEPFFSLSALENSGFHLDVTHHGERMPDAPGRGHYWVAELQSSVKMAVYTCAYLPPRSWYLFDEYVLTRNTHRR